MSNRHCPAIGSLAIGCALLSVQCSDEPAGPVPYKSPREFTWRFDTLNIGGGQTLMRRLAGSSYQRIFAVGHASDGSPGAMLRFDGTRWTTTGYYYTEGGPVRRPTTFSDTYEAPDGTVWFAGSNIEMNPAPPPTFLLPAFLVRLKQGQWSQFSPLGQSLLLCLDGRTGSDVWAGAAGGNALHFNGLDWDAEQLPITAQPPYELSIRDIALEGTLVHAICTKYDPTSSDVTYFHLIRYSSNWTVVDSLRWINGSTTPMKWGDICLWRSPSGHVFSGGQGLYQWNGIRWNKLAEESQIFGIGGISESDFMAVGSFGKVLHYDGKASAQIAALAKPEVDWQDVWYHGSKTIVIGQLGMVTLVAYGE